MKAIKVIIERHEDGYIGYPIGMKGIVVAQADTYHEALVNTESAIRFHLESFGSDALNDWEDILEAFIAETNV